MVKHATAEFISDTLKFVQNYKIKCVKFSLHSNNKVIKL